MRITELKGYRGMPAYAAAGTTFRKDAKRNGFVRSDQLDKFTEFMEENGFKALGQGYHGAVFEKPGYPWVFKVYKDDPAYGTFVNWAIKNQANPNVPRFKGRPMRIAPDTYVVRMENLRQLGGAHKDLLKVLIGLSDEWDSAEDINWAKTDEMLWLAKNHPGIHDLVSVAHRAWPDYVLDMHGGNIMLRGNTPVVVDPISG